MSLENYYPRIIFPRYFYETKTLNITLEEVHPKSRKPQPPNNSSYEDIFNVAVKSFIGFSILSSFFVYLITLFIVLIFENEKEFWASGGRSIIVASIFIISTTITILRVRWHIKADRLISQYRNSQNLEYQSSLQKYGQEEIRIKSTAFQHDFQKKELRKRASEVKQAILGQLELHSQAEVKTGLSEKFFHDYLIKYSKYKVLKNTKYRYYYPDILLVDETNNVLLDIEIDEPYSFDKKEPIHFSEKDSNRDTYLAVHNLMTVRFSEEQILNFPEYCLQVIEGTIANFLSLKDVEDFDKSIIYKHKSPAWNYESAISLANQHSRKSNEELVQVAREIYL